MNLGANPTARATARPLAREMYFVKTNPPKFPQPPAARPAGEKPITQQRDAWETVRIAAADKTPPPSAEASASLSLIAVVRWLHP